MNLLKSFDSCLGKYMRKPPPAPRVALNHQIHVAGGESGSTMTMVVVFVVCLCCFGWTRYVMSSSYVQNGTK